MNVRDALTIRGMTVHRTIDGATTLCRYVAHVVEPEEDGTKQAWRIRVRDMRQCRRCEIKLESIAEGIL